MSLRVRLQEANWSGQDYGRGRELLVVSLSSFFLLLFLFRFLCSCCFILPSLALVALSSLPPPSPDGMSQKSASQKQRQSAA